MMRRFTRALDRYVWSEFWKIFVVTALGFPVLLVIVDITENLDKYLNRQLPAAQIALSYVYFVPESMFQVLPAAVLFATVFAIGALTRHAEITAAKASGISFHRLTLPIYVGSVIAAVMALGIGEFAPQAAARRAELLQENRFTPGTERRNFAFAGDHGRVYTIGALNSARAVMEGVEIARQGSGPAYPTYVLVADRGTWTDSTGWVLSQGAMHILGDPQGLGLTIQYDSLVDRHLEETPLELTANPRAPLEMGYQDLGRYITALERSGGEADELRVERALKIAIPATCIIIALFGAPLATSTRRGGAAYGVGISLAVTVIFLVLIQLTKEVGSNGLLPPEIAAWTPNMLFGLVGAIMLVRVRT